MNGVACLWRCNAAAVIWNLLWNAVKFTNEGGRVEARLSRTDSQIEISVTDTGWALILSSCLMSSIDSGKLIARRHAGMADWASVGHRPLRGRDARRHVEASSPGKGQGATFKVRFPIAHRRSSCKRPKRPGAELKQPTGPIKWTKSKTWVRPCTGCSKMIPIHSRCSK